MSVSVCECLLCLLPSLLLLLLSLGLRWPRAELWLRLAARAAAWRLWSGICWALELPLNVTAERAWDEERGPDYVVGTCTGDRSGPEQSTPQHWPRGVACKPTALAQHLFQHCGALALPRLAAWPRGDPHVQTLRGLLWGSGGGGGGERSGVQFSRDHLLMRDGGTVALDWAVEARRGEGEAKREREHQLGAKALGCFTSTPPVLVLVPHFWGGLTPHLTELCQLALAQGFYAVVVHPRGTAGCPLTTPRLTEFGDPSDLEQAVAYVHNCHPSSVLVAVSEGSGSGVLLSYLGECGSSSRLMAAAAISPVLQGQLWFQTPMPPMYRWGALFHRKLQFSSAALGDTGGHCGFTLEEAAEEGGTGNASGNWSHAAVLEYFRLVADFLKEERRGVRWDGATAVGREGHGGHPGRSRPGATLPPPRRRRGAVVRRTRPQTQHLSEGEESGEFTWRRCYTR